MMTKRASSWLLTLTVVFAVSVMVAIFSTPSKKSAQPRGASRELTCVRVVDGDTIKLDDGHAVRLIGVDTPETVDPHRPPQFWGKEASAFTKKQAEGKKVKLVYETDEEDKYGRQLAYVYLPDGKLLNAELIAEGYGRAYTAYPFTKRDEFCKLERKAQKRGLGVWNAALRDQRKTVVVAGASFHETTCPQVALRTVTKDDALKAKLTSCPLCRP